MAKATAICTCEKCGAQFKREKICYNREEANNFEAWAVENITLCGACWKKEKEAEAAKKNDEFTPITIGSEKQIAWAIKIRLSAVEEINKFFRKNDPQKDFFQPRMIDAITSHDDARWYIDHRDALGHGPLALYGVRTDDERQFWEAIVAPISRAYKVDHVL